MATKTLPQRTFQGKPISVNKAARKYGLPQRTLAAWAARGELTILKQPAKKGEAMLVDEASVILARENHRRGREEGRGGEGGSQSVLSASAPSELQPEYSTADLAEEYHNYGKSVGFAADTLDKNRQVLTVFAQKCPTLPLGPQPILDFIRDLPWAQVTKKKYYQVLRAFYNYLVDFHNITSPLTKRMVPRIPKHPQFRVLTREEIEKLFNAAETFQERMILLTLYATRVRVGELVSLTSERLFPTHIVVSGKTGTWEVPISKDLYSQLTLLGEGALFRDDQGKPMTRDGVYHRVAKCMKLAGITGKKLGPHTLRHTSLTHLYDETGDLPLVQEGARHADIRMTMEYTHPTAAKQREKLLAHDPLRELISGQGK